METPELRHQGASRKVLMGQEAQCPFGEGEEALDIGRVYPHSRSHLPGRLAETSALLWGQDRHSYQRLGVGSVGQRAR